MRVHSYYLGKLKNVPAELNRDLLEMDLMEEFHWLPQDIAKIPYKKLQTFLIIRKQKNEAQSAKVQLESINQNNKARATSGQGQMRRSR